MKRLVKYLLAASFFSAALIPLSAEEAIDTYEYENIANSLKGPAEPQVIDEYVAFTEKSGPGFIGIAFDYENYEKIHSFKVKHLYDDTGNETSKFLFYILKRPENLKHINYRLLIDGLWTSDPMNSQKDYDWTTGLTLSAVTLGEPKPEITCIKDNNNAHFIYNGEPGQKVRLAGTFTKWDSWIYELSETKPGFYELTLPLPRGTYYYSYYVGLNSYIDKTNPNKAWSEEGKEVSVLSVN